MLGGKTGNLGPSSTLRRRLDSASRKKAGMASRFAVWTLQTCDTATKRHAPVKKPKVVRSAVAAPPSTRALSELIGSVWYHLANPNPRS